MAKIIYLIREPRFVQRDEPLLQIPKKRIIFYLAWQLFGILATVGVSQTIAGIGKTISPKQHNDMDSRTETTSQASPSSS